jgi:hypothetical protein
MNKSFLQHELYLMRKSYSEVKNNCVGSDTSSGGSGSALYNEETFNVNQSRLFS